MKIKNIPIKIYLNLGNLPNEEINFLDLSQVTWSKERINKTDLEFIYFEVVKKFSIQEINLINENI